MKTKFTLFIIFFIFFSFISISQNDKIDSLYSVLKNAKHDTTKIKTLTTIGIFEYNYRKGYWDTIIKKCDDGLLKNKNTHPLKYFYSKFKATSLIRISFLYMLEGDTLNAINYSLNALNLGESINDKIGIAEAYHNLGIIYMRMNNTPKSLIYYHRSLKIIEQMVSSNGEPIYKKEIASKLHNLGMIYESQNNITKALEYYFKSLKLNEEIGETTSIAIGYNNIGNIYLSQKNISQALKFLLKSLKKHEENNYKVGIANSLNNIGIVYTEWGNPDCVGKNELCRSEGYEKAIGCFQRSKEIYEELNNKRGISTSLNSFGRLYLEKGDITSALDYFNKSLILNEEMKDNYGVSLNLFCIAKCYFKLGKIKEAKLNGERSLELSQKLVYLKNIHKTSNLLRLVYSQTGEWKKAFEMNVLYFKLNDSISNEANSKAIIQNQYKFEYEKKSIADSLIILEERKLSSVKFEKEKTQRYALYGGLVLVLAFAGFMFNRFKLTQKQKKVIESQKHIVEEKHKEITDSINYAERIQRSFLATSTILDENLNDYFVYFQPKDVVSGDFYWANKLNDGNFALATADSTGHGVPGAIMSLLNITSLESAINDGNNEPAEILNHTRQTIIERLKKDGSKDGGKDGMDASLVCFDFKNYKFKYATANNPIWIVRQNELIELKGDKMPIGKHDKDQVPFTQLEFELKKGDVVYTLTDGFPDQFGGPKGKKFMYKQLKETLVSLSARPLSEQKDLLKTILKDWMSDVEQVDDITIIGIRI